MSNEKEAARRWRLVLGQDANESLALGAADAAIDGALDALYGAGPDTRSGGLGGARRRAWRAGWATSASTSRPASCR